MELMMAILILGVLSSVAAQVYSQLTLKAHMAEPITYAGTLKHQITIYYTQHFKFPENNQQAGIPAFNKKMSGKLKSVTIENGAIHLLIGNKVPKQLEGKYLTFRPAIDESNEVSPVSWLCGYQQPTEDLKVIGENKTDISKDFLYGTCGG